MQVKLTNHNSGLTRTLEAPDYWTINEIKQWNEWGGQYFFEPATIRFFRSRVLSQVMQGPGGIYFVTSEKRCFDDYTRVFTVRKFNPTDGSIDTVRYENGNNVSVATRARALRKAYDFANP